jgi:hypothetical protein
MGESKGKYMFKVQHVGRSSTPERRALKFANRHIGVDTKVALAMYYDFYAIDEEEMLEGYLVQTPNFNICQSVTGIFDPNRPEFNREVNKLGFSVTMNKSLLNKLKNVNVEIIGTHDTTILSHISGIKDPSTRKEDDTFTVGKTLFIYGQRIRILGEPQVNPDAIEAGIGVFFVPPTGATVQVPALGIYQNDPSFVQVEVPSTLAKNTLFTLRIVTRYTDGGSLLKTPRVIEYRNKIKSNT